MIKTYSLYISHSWNYDDVLQDIETLINGRGYFPAKYIQEAKALPICSDLSWVVKENISRKLEQSDVVLAISNIFDSDNEWMLWEMDQAKELGLNVIGIVPRGQKRISQEVDKRTNVNVPWNGDNIIEAICRYSK